MLQLTLHSLGIGATVSPETFSNVRAMLPLRVTPTKLITTRGPTVHSYYATKPNGAKPSTAGTRHRFDRLQTVMADGNFGAPLHSQETPASLVIRVSRHSRGGSGPEPCTRRSSQALANIFH
jgi:hypothetical protein